MPAPLTSVCLSVCLVGQVRPGLSRARVPSFGLFSGSLNAVVVESIPVALLAYMEAFAVGRKYAEVRHTGRQEAGADHSLTD